MSTSEQRLAANRANAALSTGPSTVEGKSVSSRNATRHGLFSSDVLLDHENQAAYDNLLGHLAGSLVPVGAVESAFVERIAVTLWRQRRLVHAETASLRLTHQANQMAKAVSSELGRGYGHDLRESDLLPFDAASEQWSRAVIAEIETLQEIDLRSIEKHAPLTFAQLQSDASEDEEETVAFVAGHKGGLTGYVGELLLWCQRQIKDAELRPTIMNVADQLRTKRLVLPTDALDVLTRYQTSLDNQLFKLLRNLRDAQEWRLKTLEPMVVEVELVQE